jgi:hypothetical protein
MGLPIIRLRRQYWVFLAIKGFLYPAKREEPLDPSPIQCIRKAYC